MKRLMIGISALLFYPTVTYSQQDTMAAKNHKTNIIINDNNLTQGHYNTNNNDPRHRTVIADSIPVPAPVREIKTNRRSAHAVSNQ